MWVSGQMCKIAVGAADLSVAIYIDHSSKIA
jgi:hypothetical protein